MVRVALMHVCVLLLVASAATGQSPSPGVMLSGVVLDQTGGALAGASVDLVNGSGAVVQSTAADEKGEFHFGGVAAGSYEVRAAFEGFKQGSSRVRVGARAPQAQKIVLGLTDIKQEITVSNSAAEIGSTPSNNVDAIAVDRSALDSLPIFDQDVIGTLSRFLDSGAVGSGGPTIVVNGMEVSALRVSASAVQQIKINQDPYSAEYARPGRGRIEILTKPGGQTFEGEGNLIVRDARFDARNAFAAVKPPENKRIFEGVLGGPVGHSGKTAFMLSANDNSDDQQAEVFAIGPAGAIHDIAPQQNRDALVSLNLNHQWSDKTTISIRPAYKYEKNENRGVGGTTLASAGTTFTHHEEQVVYTQQTTCSS